MIITPHILAGAAIGSKIHNYWSVAILSVASHYFLDLIPHKEYDIAFIKRKIFGKGMIFEIFKLAVDFSVGFGLGASLARGNFSYVLVGMFFGILPDIFSILVKLFNFPFPATLSKFHEDLHFWQKYQIPDWIKYGSQILVLMVVVWVMAK